MTNQLYLLSNLIIRIRILNWGCYLDIFSCAVSKTCSPLRDEHPPERGSNTPYTERFDHVLSGTDREYRLRRPRAVLLSQTYPVLEADGGVPVCDNARHHIDPFTASSGRYLPETLWWIHRTHLQNHLDIWKIYISFLSTTQKIASHIVLKVSLVDAWTTHVCRGGAGMDLFAVDGMCGMVC